MFGSVHPEEKNTERGGNFSYERSSVMHQTILSISNLGVITAILTNLYRHLFRKANEMRINH